MLKGYFTIKWVYLLCLPLFLLISVSEGWCEKKIDTDIDIADSKLCSSNINVKENALKNIRNPKDYFLKYDEWKCQEKFIWDRICQGKDINLSAHNNQSLPLMECKEEGRQIINPRFLRTILLVSTLRNIISHDGVRIHHAIFRDELDLSRFSLNFPLEFSETTFEKIVDLSWLKTDSTIVFDKSIFKEGFDFNNIETKSDLKIVESIVNKLNGYKKTSQNDVNWLFGAKIGDQLILSKSVFLDFLNLRKVKVVDCIVANGVVFNKMVDMLNAEVGGCVLFNNANNVLTNGRKKHAFAGSGSLILNNAKVGHILEMQNAIFNQVELSNAEIGNDLVLERSEFSGELKMEKIRVEGDLLAKGIVLTTKEGLYLVNSEINKNLDLSDSKNLSSVNLASATISGDLILPKLDGGDPSKASPLWKGDAVLTLRDSEVTNLIETEGSWPEHLDLFGFRYKRLYSSTERDSSKRDSSKRDPSNFHERKDWWIKGWFKRNGENIEQKKCDLKITTHKQNSCQQKGFSLQPYFQMASVLEESGNKDRANDIRLWGKQEEAKRATGIRYWWMFFQWLFIGYGYSNWHVWIVFLVFLFVGWGVFKLAVLSLQPGVDISAVRDFEFSLDLLLPIIELNKENHDKALHGFSCGYRWYFYFHKIMGHVLAAYLIAGLTGLGK